MRVLREIEKLSWGYWAWRVLSKEYPDQAHWQIVKEGTAVTERRAWRKARRYG